MSFDGRTLGFQIFYPTLADPISQEAVSVVDGDVEFEDTSDLDLHVPGVRVVNADIDVYSDTILYTVDESSGSFLITPGFNGYKIYDYDQTVDPIVGLTVIDGPDALPIKPGDIFFSHNAIFVDVDGLSFSRGDTIEIEVTFGSPDLAGQYVPEEIAAVARLYEAAFGRVPDNAGVNFWIDVLEDGTGIDLIASFFLDSDEFKERFGEPQILSDRELVETLYENILDRAGEQGGIDFWTGLLASDAIGRDRILVEFAVSAENVEGTGYIDDMAQNLAGTDWLIV